MDVSRLKQLIEQGCENEYLDFKLQFHGNKAELLHDILCLANNTQFQDAYLLFGINDNGQIVGVENHQNRLNSANIHDFLNGNRAKFFNNVAPDITVFTFQYSGHEIDVLQIKSTFNLPYFLIEPYHEDNKTVRSGHVYSRTGDRNTPIDQYASPSQVETLWKKRFFLLEKPYEKFLKYLDDLSNWKLDKQRNRGFVRYYYEPEPSFIVEDSIDYEDDELLPTYQAQPYGVTSIFRGSYRCIANNVVVESGDLYFIDDGKGVFPETEYHTFKNCPSSWFVLSMDYYLMDSSKYKLLSLFNDKENGRLSYGLQLFYNQTLFFSSEIEKDEFIFEVNKNIHHIIAIVEKLSNIDFNNAEYDREKHDQFRIHTGQVLKKMQKELQLIRLMKNETS